MYYTVYQITNKINKKIYIGKHQTKNLEDEYFGSGKYLNRAIEKYGVENFQKEILHIFETEEEMNSKEAELVTEEFCLREDTYNLCVGGKGGFSYINRNKLGVPNFTKENASEMSKKGLIALEEKRKDLIWYQEHYRKVSEGVKRYYKDNSGYWLGRKHTEKTIKKMRESAKGAQEGSKNSQYGTIWITNGIESKKIKKDSKIPIGWFKGRIMSR